MIALKIKEENAERVRRELRKFKVPFQERCGSTLFVLPVIARNMLLKLRCREPSKNWREFDEVDIYHFLLYLTQIGIRAKLVFHV